MGALRDHAFFEYLFPVHIDLNISSSGLYNYVSYRLIWTVFVTIAIGLFVYQAGSRTHTFYKYNTDVDSAVIYTNEMAFPTVTLCNQNAYRWVLIIFLHTDMCVSINSL